MLREHAVADGVGLRVRWEADRCVLHLSGELDLSSADLLRDSLEALLGGARVVVVDLAEVPFADCAGIRPVLEAAERARRRGQRVEMRDVPTSILRIQSATGATLVDAQARRIAS